MRLFIGTALLILATFFVEPDPMRSPLGHYPEMDYSGAIYTLWYEYEVEEQDDQYLPEDGEVYFALLNENGELASQEVTTKRGNSFVFDCPDISACRVVTDVDYKTHEGTYWQLDGRMADTGLLTGRFRRYSGTNAYQIAYTARHKQDLSFLIGIMAISVIIWILFVSFYDLFRIFMSNGKYIKSIVSGILAIIMLISVLFIYFGGWITVHLATENVQFGTITNTSFVFLLFMLLSIWLFLKWRPE